MIQSSGADIVLSVANPSHTLFVAQMFHIPIKDPGDILLGASTKDLYLGLAILFAYVFLDGDTTKSFSLRTNAKKATQKLKKLVRLVVEAITIGENLHLNKLFDMGSNGKLLSDYGTNMIERLIRGGKPVDDVVAEILPTAAAAVATQAQAMSQMLDIYLQPEHAKHWPNIRGCAYSDNPEDFEKLKKYALEACRLAPAAFGLFRDAAAGGTIQDDKKIIRYEKGDKIYTDFVSAGRDEKVFLKNANEIDITRDPSLYIHHGIGPHACIGRKITEVSLAVQLKLFAKLKNLQRVPGLAGKLKHTTHFPGNPEGIRVYMTEDWSSWWPFPTSKFFLSPFSHSNDG